ncbi:MULTISPECIES: conjugal transfer protein TrbF [unclassified Sphingomonas]|jgi:type IV secretory pathway TrbF-like protein|uniref:conjugal transfer protein TrbF n=1 Tax=unclassified Sphingomonas TaxID=196159 RepID=UPI0021509E6F|nr:MULTISPECIES: conjugal transfer protein TrbF [unclassified Sphingomonas]MCR5871041.1 conjugal transfer protein TrbF [Sphingomonas sp. J344]UUY00638.1 conjugal transfer protein TrbF [Sphingomonas sp. J315]
MRFKRAVERYGRTPEPETPYQRAGQLWDERIGSARVQARNWRLMAFGGLFLTTGLSAALVWQSMQSRVVPYVIEVDRLGEARSVAPAAVDYRPTDPQIAWHLGRFVTNLRSRSLDPVLMRENWLSAYDFATERGALFLGEYARTSNPFAEVGRKTVSVQVTSVVRASDTSFQVKWTESAYERGSLAGTSRWTAMLTVKVQSPRSADVLRKNPLGLYVDAIDWSRELEAPAERAPSSQPIPSPAETPATAPPAGLPLGSPLDPNLSQPAAAPSPERNAR